MFNQFYCVQFCLSIFQFVNFAVAAIGEMLLLLSSNLIQILKDRFKYSRVQGNLYAAINTLKLVIVSVFVQNSIYTAATLIRSLSMLRLTKPIIGNNVTCYWQT